MTAQDAVTLQQLRDALGAPTIEDEIRGVATMASIGLALLTFFTNRQADTLATLRADLQAYDAGEVRRQLLRDGLLVLLTAGGYSGLAPLVVPVLDGLQLFARAGALRTLFLVIFLGYTALLLFQVSVLWRRAGRLGEKVNRNRFIAAVSRVT
jgi:hypothetical protein